MDLTTFIEKTLTQIIEGTKAACNNITQDNESGCINPQGISDLSIHVVSFDVALTVEEAQNNTQESQNTTGGKIQIAQIFSIGHNRGKKNTEEVHELNQAICRIKFDIPIRLPATTDQKKDKMNADKAKTLQVRKLPMPMA